jgi:hypothetical protein
MGPGALVAGVGSGLVNAHDSVARTLLGDAAKPMLIAAPSPRSGDDEGESPTAVPARAVVRWHQAASTSTGTSPADATSADLDGDGTVSLDEILALGRCGASEADVLERLERTGRTFELSTAQEQYLRVRGVSDDLIARLRTLNRPPPVSPESYSAS